ncbi:hypothetical protein NPIL_272381 [Nephila pilipes]|uniref:Mutator-like transposase domain-containing protein n=1 Tax=Nephila pilipes TaxID=299642 RepID=A0A8X6QDE5_NEPPI|nr:hypothetical protein NPIL_272381 [Nephila pilipes]
MSLEILGNVLEFEFMSKLCRLCYSKNEALNTIRKCAKRIGSSGVMEPVGMIRLFDCSVEMKKLQHVNIFGAGDSKGNDAVKDIDDQNTMTK